MVCAHPMAKDTFGKLSLLKRGGSSSRVIDLVSVAEHHHDTPSYHDAPLFQDRRLNTSFLIKHTLRPWEREQLGGARVSATKLILPISDKDLDMGGHSIFVEDPSLSETLSAHLGQAINAPKFKADIERLRELALLPSFDPYLLHEHFRRTQANVSDVYFTISPSELQGISDFVAGQVNVLVRRALKDDGVASLNRSRRLASILFEDSDSPKLDVLRKALKLSEDDYREGVFGWKGTLYYSWRAGQCHQDMMAFIKSLKAIDLKAMTSADRQEVQRMIKAIGQHAGQRWSRLQNQLQSYHFEFTRFAERGDPAALTAFLLRAPELFIEMGEDISRLQHVSAYWSFWTRGRQLRALTGAEAFDLLPDFEAALMTTASPQAA